MQRLDKIIDGKRFGNKALRLAKLIAADFPVKDGLGIDIDEVRQIIEGRRSPQTSGLTGDSFAVRSSAVGEDSTLSWAGQFKTTLFVRSVNLGQTIIECANAQNNATVASYAKTHKIEIPQLALIVQEMVDAEAAGVLFTINPITGAEEMIIEAVTGVSMDLLDGSRCPAVRYHINPKDGKIIKKESGNQEDPLSTMQISKLISFGERIQKLFDCPQDIEWAIERGTGKIFINQSRDITTLDNESTEAIRTNVISTIRANQELEAKRLQACGLIISGENFLSDQNIAELITPHPCQMAFGLFTYEFAHGNGAIRTARNELGYDIGPELETGFFWLIGGQPRCSIIHDALTYRIKGIPLSDYGQIIHYYLERIAEDHQLANYPEVVLYNQDPPLDFLTELFGEEKAKRFRLVYEFFFDRILAAEAIISGICRKEFLPQWESKIAQYRRQKCGDNLPELIERFRQICELLRTNACPMFVKVARLGFFAYARLLRLLTNLFGTEGKKHLDVLTSGISPEMNPNLRFNIQLAKLKKGSIPLNDAIAEFGHLSPHELEISYPRYREKPEFLQQLADKIDRDPIQDFNRAAERSSELARKLMKAAGKSQAILAREIEAARTYLPLREVVKFYFLQAYDFLRETALNIERVLDWEDGLIFHLDPKEIFNLKGHENELDVIAKQRYKAFRSSKSLYVPAVISVGKLEKIGYLEANGEKILYLHGIGVTNFVAEGQVVVIEDLNKKDALAKLHRGAILVATTTDPAWTPLLSVIGREGGLVTEIGGLLAHGAIYAREVGMAAVLNVPNATHILKTGMRVRVNGSAGYVEILDP